TVRSIGSRAPRLPRGVVGNQYGNGPIGTGVLGTFDNEKAPRSGLGSQRSGAVIPDRRARSAAIRRGSAPRARRADSESGRSRLESRFPPGATTSGAWAQRG